MTVIALLVLIHLYSDCIGVNLTEEIVGKWVDEESMLGADAKFNISKLIARGSCLTGL